MSTVKIIYTFVFLLSQKLLKWNLTQDFLISLLYLLTQLSCNLSKISRAPLFSQVGLKSFFVVAQSLGHVWLFAWPMDCSMPGFPVLHYLPEFAQTHVHRVSDAISSPVAPFSSCLQSFPASGSFPMSQLFASDGWSIGASASALVLPMNIQDWLPLGFTGLISLQSKGLSRVFPNTTDQKHVFGFQPSLWSNPHIHTWLLEKP